MARVLIILGLYVALVSAERRSHAIPRCDAITLVPRSVSGAAARSTGRAASPRRAATGDYEETLPLLAGGRERAILVVYRSGDRSLLAADVMQRMGFVAVASLKTGVRGWNDFEEPLVDEAGRMVDGDTAECLLASRADQRRPR